MLALKNNVISNVTDIVRLHVQYWINPTKYGKLFVLINYLELTNIITYFVEYV